MTPSEAVDAVADIAASLLPRNASQLEKAILAAELARIALVDPTIIVRIWNPDTCPSELLSFLAQAVSVDVWSADWTDAQKRKVIAASPLVHRFKGTRGAVSRALNAFDIRATIVEWWEDSSRRGTFRVDLLYEDGGPIYDPVINGFATQAVDGAKPKSRVFVTRAILRATGPLYVGVFGQTHLTATAHPFAFDVPVTRASSYVGATAASFISATAHPRT